MKQLEPLKSSIVQPTGIDGVVVEIPAAVRQESGRVLARVTVSNGRPLSSDVIELDNAPRRQQIAKDAAKVAPDVISDWRAIEATLVESAVVLDATLPAVRAGARRDDADEVDPSSGPYRETPHGLVWDKPTRDGPVPTPLCNFVARIVADIEKDDGSGELQHVFEIEARRGGMVRRASVSVEKFAGMHWPMEQLGATAVVYAGYGAKDHVRAAVQLLSDEIPVRRVFTHLGWRKIGDDWVYLHGSGGVGPDGVVPGVEVRLEGNLSGYVLPDPKPPADLVREIRASMALLEVGPRRVTVPLFAAIHRAVLATADFGEHLHGPSGALKTALLALAQQHYGAGIDARNLPGSWSSTGNSLEGLAFLAKDALLAVDDFAPGGTIMDVQRYHKEADRVFRAQGNLSGRGRARADGTPRPARPPRGMIISSGEDVPRGQSVRARVFLLDVAKGEIDSERIRRCQRDAADGLYAASLVGFVGWLAPRYEQVRAEMRAEHERLRELAQRSDQHLRTPSIVADLALGLRYFLAYAAEAGAITAAEAETLRSEWWAALGEAAARQDEHQAAREPAQRFVQLLASALGSGEAHIADHEGEAPKNAKAWGWRIVTVGAGENEREEWRPQGKRVGWLDGDALYLEPDAAYAAAQEIGRKIGDALAVTPQTLRKRLHERGWLASTDEKRETLTVRRTLEGRQRNVLHVATSKVSPSGGPDKPDNSAVEGAPSSGGLSGSLSGSAADPTPETADSEREQAPNVGFVGFPAGGGADAATGGAPVSGGAENPTPNPTRNPTASPDRAGRCLKCQAPTADIRRVLCEDCDARRFSIAEQPEHPPAEKPAITCPDCGAPTPHSAAQMAACLRKLTEGDLI